ncbi:AAA family ATPase [Flavobacterium oreochromis]|uniref:AAA family ATPase n=1 Tax=Flavobacterium oreochromis TaxID=2906078 RepID=UPI00385EE4BE
MEKIKDIAITNFKSIKHLEINECNRINVFIGMPNAGKSNILEALGLLGYLNKTYYLEDLKKFVRISNHSDIFFEGNVTERLLIDTNQYSIDGLYLNEKLYLTYQEGEKNYKITFDFKSIKVERETWESYNLIKPYSFTNHNENLERLDYFKSLGRQSLVYPYGNNLAQILSITPILRNEVNAFFKQNNLKLLIDKGTSELKIFKEFQDGTVFTLPYNMIADTLQRLIFYKAAIMSNENSVLLFEEPEAHCFEPYILEFTNSVKYDKNDNQFFIVTHSDFIIQEFLRDEESKQNTNIYLVNNVNGETKVKLLEKDKNEDVYELGMNPFFNFETLWENN